MALSDYDTLAWSEAGPCTGGMISDGGVSVEIYKTWLYIGHPVAWREGGYFIEPTVMELQEGRVRYHDVEIIAVRGPQHGVFTIAASPSWHSPTKILVGCGVSGYYTGHEPDEGPIIIGSDDEYVPPPWLGVTDESRQFIKDLVGRELSEYTPKDHPARHIDWDAGLRFNQGDAFFAARLGVDVPATAPGEAELPVFMRMIGGMDQGDETPGD